MRPRLQLLNRQPFRGMWITALVGVVLVSLPPLAWLSYDVSHLARPLVGPAHPITNVAIIYADELTSRELGDGRRVHWTNHARLLDRLTQDGARAVLYDFVFDVTNSEPRAATVFADAIRRQQSVILVRPKVARDGVEILESPLTTLDNAARGAGHGELFDDVVRRLSGDYLGVEYAGWLVAQIGDSNRLSSMNRNEERWLCYHGLPPNLGLQTYPFEDVISNAVPPGTFAGKLVVVGAQSSVSDIGALKETFATPYGLFRYPRAPGAAIHATAIANLMHGETMRLLSRWEEYSIAVLYGVALIGLLYNLARRSRFVLIAGAVISGLLLTLISLWVQWHFHVWWVWLAGAVGQTTTATVYVWRHRPRDRYVAFISYRTEDDGAAALLIQRSLADRGLNLFLDVKSLEAGHFDAQLLREIESASFFVLILSPKSLARCANPDDWVLRELTHALSKGKPIVPVFRGGFNFDAKEHIPDLPQIAELRRFQGVLYSNADFDGFMEKLVKLLKT